MGISNGPAMAASDATGMADKVRVFIAHAQSVAGDGLTISEFGELLFALMRICVELAESFPVAGSERKEWVLHGVGVLFDAIADKVVPAYLWPFWVMFRPGFRALVLRLASGGIEAILPLIRGEQ